MFSLKIFIARYLIIFGAFLLAAVLGLLLAWVATHLSLIAPSLVSVTLISVAVILLFSIKE